MINFIVFVLLSGMYQHQTGWDLLATTKLSKGFDQFLSEEIDIPEFSQILKEKDGQKITLEGFIIPLQQATSQNYFILSRFPYQSCFFCGAAGPETVVEVYTKEKFRVTDEKVRVTGRLKLNPDDALHLFFILNDAQVTQLD